MTPAEVATLRQQLEQERAKVDAMEHLARDYRGSLKEASDQRDAAIARADKLEGRVGELEARCRAARCEEFAESYRQETARADAAERRVVELERERETNVKTLVAAVLDPESAVRLRRDLAAAERRLQESETEKGLQLSVIKAHEAEIEYQKELLTAARAESQRLEREARRAVTMLRRYHAYVDKEGVVEAIQILDAIAAPPPASPQPTTAQGEEKPPAQAPLFFDGARHQEDYARLTDQVATLTRERDEAIENVNSADVARRAETYNKERALAERDEARERVEFLRNELDQMRRVRDVDRDGARQYASSLNDTIAKHWSEIGDLRAQLEAEQAGATAMRQALIEWIEEHGAPHSGYCDETHWIPCPEDDTCDCELVATINAALSSTAGSELLEAHRREVAGLKAEVRFRDKLIAAVRVRCRSEIERWTALVELFNRYDYGDPPPPQAASETVTVAEQCARIAEAQPFYPDTQTGTRQQWVKDQIAEKIRERFGGIS